MVLAAGWLWMKDEGSRWRGRGRGGGRHRIDKKERKLVDFTYCCLKGGRKREDGR